MLVLWLHLAMSGFWGLHYPASLGRLGVSLFFVLSGFLITHLYLRDQPPVVTFWWRRALRIFPAFYAYLAVVAVLWAVGVYSLPATAFAAAALYLMNFYRSYRGWPLEHTWSLAIEEQFYLLWPPVLKRLGPRRAELLLILLLAAWPLQRFLRTGQWGHPSAEQALFVATFDAIVWGCLMALRAYAWPGWRPRTGGAALALLVVISTAVFPYALPVVLLPIIRNAALAWIVGWVALSPKGAFRPLEGAVLGWFGTRSYSLYLWHLLFCDPRLASMPKGQLAPLGAVLAAELSYRLVEQPVLRWRDRQSTEQPR